MADSERQVDLLRRVAELDERLVVETDARRAAEAQVDHIQGELDQLLTTFDEKQNESQAALEKAEHEIRFVRQQRQSFEGKLESLEKEVGVKDRENNQLLEQINNQQLQIREKQEELISKSKDFDIMRADLTAQINRLVSESEHFRSLESGDADTKKQLENAVFELTSKNQTYDKTIEDQRAKITDLKNELGLAKKELEIAAAETTVMEEMLQSAQNDVERLAVKNQIYESQFEVVAASSTKEDEAVSTKKFEPTKLLDQVMDAHARFDTDQDSDDLLNTSTSEPSSPERKRSLNFEKRLIRERHSLKDKITLLTQQLHESKLKYCEVAAENESLKCTVKSLKRDLQKLHATVDKGALRNSTRIKHVSEIDSSKPKTHVPTERKMKIQAQILGVKAYAPDLWTFFTGQFAKRRLKAEYQNKELNSLLQVENTDNLDNESTDPDSLCFKSVELLPRLADDLETAAMDTLRLTANPQCDTHVADTLVSPTKEDVEVTNTTNIVKVRSEAKPFEAKVTSPSEGRKTSVTSKSTSKANPTTESKSSSRPRWGKRGLECRDKRSSSENVTVKTSKSPMESKESLKNDSSMASSERQVGSPVVVLDDTTPETSESEPSSKDWSKQDRNTKESSMSWKSIKRKLLFDTKSQTTTAPAKVDPSRIPGAPAWWRTGTPPLTTAKSTKRTDTRKTVSKAPESNNSHRQANIATLPPNPLAFGLDASTNPLAADLDSPSNPPLVDLNPPSNPLAIGLEFVPKELVLEKSPEPLASNPFVIPNNSAIPSIVKYDNSDLDVILMNANKSIPKRPVKEVKPKKKEVPKWKQAAEERLMLEREKRKRDREAWARRWESTRSGGKASSSVKQVPKQKDTKTGDSQQNKNAKRPGYMKDTVSHGAKRPASKTVNTTKTVAPKGSSSSSVRYTKTQQMAVVQRQPAIYRDLNQLKIYEGEEFGDSEWLCNDDDQLRDSMKFTAGGMRSTPVPVTAVTTERTLSGAKITRM